jgi:putative membrane protein
VLGFAAQLADDVLPEAMWERIVTSLPGVTVLGLLTVAGVVAVFAWLLAIASTALTFGGFELRRDGDRLLVSHGLLERRRRSIPGARIQAITVGEGLLRQPFGLAALRFESAGYGTDTPESGVLFPLLRRAEVPALLAAAVPAYAAPLDPAALAPPPPRARRRYVLPPMVSPLLLAAAGAAVAAAVPWLRWWWGLAPLALAPIAALHGWLRFRDTGWRLVDGGLFVARTGGIERVTTIVARRRLQRRSVAQDPFQRRADLASFDVAVASGGAGGRVRLDHLDAGVAAGLLDALGVDGRGGRPRHRTVAAVAAPGEGASGESPGAAEG